MITSPILPFLLTLACLAVQSGDTAFDLPETLVALRTLIKEHGNYKAIREATDQNLKVLCSWLDGPPDQFPSVIVIAARSDEQSKPFSRRLRPSTTSLDVVLVKRVRIHVIAGAKEIIVRAQPLTTNGGEAAHRTGDVFLTLGTTTAGANPVQSTAVKPLGTVQAVRDAFSSVDGVRSAKVISRLKDGLHQLSLGDYFNMEGGIASIGIEPKTGADKAVEGVDDFVCRMTSPTYHVDLTWEGNTFAITKVLQKKAG